MGRSLVRVYLDHVLCRGYAIHTKCMHSEGDDALSKRRKWRRLKFPFDQSKVQKQCDTPAEEDSWTYQKDDDA